MYNQYDIKVFITTVAYLMKAVMSDAATSPMSLLDYEGGDVRAMGLVLQRNSNQHNYYYGKNLLMLHLA